MRAIFYINNMLVSNKHQLIHIKIPKTGSAFFTSFLVNNFDFKSAHNNIHEYFSLTEKGMYRFCESGKELFDIDQHFLTKDDWLSFKKMAIVRNPYQKFVSAFLHFKRLSAARNHVILQYGKESVPDEPHLNSLSAFIEYEESAHPPAYCHAFISQYDHLVAEDGEIHIDYVLKFENLYDDVSKALKTATTIDVETIESVCNESKTIDFGKTNYAEYYSEMSLAYINTKFKKDFDRFEYAMYNTLDELKQAQITPV